MSKECRFKIAGDTSLIEDIRRDKTLMRKTGIVNGGGAMAGAIGAGFLEGLQDAHLLADAKAFIGSSAGGGNVFFAAAGRPDLAGRIYERNIELGIFKFNPGSLLRKRIMDYSVLASLREELGPELINQLSERVLAFGSNVRFCVTEATSGQTRYISLDKEDDVVNLLIASTFIPSAGGKQGWPAGQYGDLYDGAIIDHVPFEHMAQSMEVENIIVLINTSLNHMRPIPSAVIGLLKLLHPNFTEKYHKDLKVRHHQINKGVDKLRTLKEIEKKRLAVIFPDRSYVSFAEGNIKTLRKSSLEARIFVRDLFS